MTRKVVVLSSMLSALFFPWPLTLILAFAGAIFEPLLPLATGIFIDALYYVGGIPWGTLIGLLATIAAIFVRSQLKTSIIEE